MTEANGWCSVGTCSSITTAVTSSLHVSNIRSLAGSLQGALAALDLSEESELLGCLVPDWLRPLRTTYEGDFGTPLGDFYFFPSKLLVRMLSHRQHCWLDEPIMHGAMDCSVQHCVLGTFAVG